MDRLRALQRSVAARPAVASLIETAALLAAAIPSLLLQRQVNDLGGSPDRIPLWLAIIWTVALIVPFAGRRRWPLGSLAVLGGVFCAYRLWNVPEWTVSEIVLFLSFVFAGRDGGPRRDWARAGVVAGLVVAFVIAVVRVEVPDEYRPVVSWHFGYSIAYNIFFVTAAWLLGDALRRRREREAELSERTAQLEVERERNARRAVTDERLRIARELHDVVAHHVSVMGVQAGAARRMIDRDPARAADALGTVEASSRQAVDELSRLVGFLRSDEQASLSPTPGLDGVEHLLTDTRRTGLEVVGRVEGSTFPVARSVGLSVYRIVQEALTNTIKHAHASRAEVTLRYAEPAVEVEIRDDGLGHPPPPYDAAQPNGTGHGLAGMRERVALHDGTLSTGPDPRGGYRVAARFPRAGDGA